MARTEGVYVAGNNVTEIPDGGSVRVEIFSEAQNHATDTPLYTWPVSVQDGRFVIDIPTGTVADYPDRAKFSIVATMTTGEKVRRLIEAPGGSTLLQRKRTSTVSNIPTLVEDGYTLTGDTYTFNVYDPDPKEGRHYDLILDGRDTGLSIVYPETEIVVTQIPENGKQLPWELQSWEFTDYDAHVSSYGAVTAYSELESAGIDTSGMTALALPVSDIAEGGFDSADWSTLIDSLSSIFWEANGTDVVSVGETHGKRSMCIRLAPTVDGSTRVGAGASLTPSSTYSIAQWVYLDPSFDWGGTNEGGKLGYGLGGGSRPAGGLPKQDGFTSRFMWRTGGELFAYVYDASTDPDQYGDDYSLGVVAPRGEWFQLVMEVGINSVAGAADGTLKCWVNGLLRLDRSNMEWFGTGTPQIDSLILFTFHGGDDYSWAPSRTNTLCLADVAWQAAAIAPAVAPSFTTSPSSSSPTSYGFVVTFEANQKVQAYTEVRASGGDWLVKTNEESFRWSEHIQTIKGLLAATEYEYRVTITTSAGVTLTSSIGTLTTEPIADSGQFDSTKHLGGIMYGARGHGWRVNHNLLGRSNYVAIRFVSEETGNMVRISKHNRTAAHYSEGQAGAYIVKIVPSVNGAPDESTVLGHTDLSSTKTQAAGHAAGESRHWIDFVTAAPLVAGTEYWQIWDAQTAGGYGRSIFNSSQVGNYYTSVSGITDRGPYPGPYDMKMYDKVNSGDEWLSLRPYLIPWVCWEMSSGRIRGNTMVPIYGQNLDDTGIAASRTIEGSKIARQRFTADRDLTLDGMWLFYGHSWKHGIDGSALTVRVKNSSGQTLAVGSYPAIQALSDICRAGEAANDVEARTTRTWGYTDFSSDVNIVNGQTYDIELSSGASGGFAITASYPWAQSDYADGIYERTQQWQDSNATIISEGYWTPTDTQYPSGYNNGAREIDMKLTIKGQPKRMY